MYVITPKFGILIIGFNRPSFVIDRLKEIQKLSWAEVKIYVSLDFPRIGNSQDQENYEEIKESLGALNTNSSLQLLLENSNKGCDVHIPSAISKVFRECDGVLVIEDDISINVSEVENILQFAVMNYNEGETKPIVSMSGLAGDNLLRFNRWRKTSYFTAWGYFLFKDFWTLHKQISECSEPNIQSLLKRSTSWERLGRRKQNIWIERFSRGNYDYRIQRSLFVLDAKVYAPLFRVANNLGFEDSSAAHTRYPAPLFLRKMVNSSERISKPKRIKNSLIESVLQWLDSNSWAGDGIISKRGRSVGVRSCLKDAIKRLGKI